MSEAAIAKAPRKPKLRQVSVSGGDEILWLDIGEIRPSPENEKLYRPVVPSDPEIVALAKSIREHGLHEPIVVTCDGWILSGHRRCCAAGVAGLRSVPCRILEIRRCDDIDAFVRLLREFNRQRDKSADEKLREELVTINPDEAYQALITYRESIAEVSAKAIEISGIKRRCDISKAKMPFLSAIKKVLEARRKFWPLSDRQIHYALLNDPPLKHASKPDSVYRNDEKSYHSLTELLTRARLFGVIPMDCIADETRPVQTWHVHRDSRGFIRAELDDMMKGYWRDLMQSQPNHVEILAEKNTLLSIVSPIAMRYCIPVTSGRGFSSLPPRYMMAKRFAESGKERFVLLIISDFDPDGEEIAHSFARSLRDDFGIANIEPIKVAMTHRQIAEHNLQPQLDAKSSSTNYHKFVSQYGTNVFEVEALPPEVLQRSLQDAIDSVIDANSFNAEIDRERDDNQYLEGLRRVVQGTVRDALGGKQ